MRKLKQTLDPTPTPDVDASTRFQPVSHAGQDLHIFPADSSPIIDSRRETNRSRKCSPRPEDERQRVYQRVHQRAVICPPGGGAINAFLLQLSSSVPPPPVFFWVFFLRSRLFAELRVDDRLASVAPHIALTPSSPTRASSTPRRRSLVAVTC